MQKKSKKTVRINEEHEPQTAEHAVTANEIFLKYDLDGDGTISLEELTFLLQDLNPGAFSEEQVSLIMDSLDVNEDGCLQVEEFVAWMMGVEDIPSLEVMAAKKASRSGQAVPQYEIGQFVEVWRNSSEWSPGCVSAIDDDKVTIYLEGGAEDEDLKKEVPFDFLESHVRPEVGNSRSSKPEVVKLRLRIGNRYQGSQTRKGVCKHRWTMFVEEVRDDDFIDLKLDELDPPRWPGEWAQYIDSVKFGLTPHFFKDCTDRTFAYTCQRTTTDVISVPVTISWKSFVKSPPYQVEHLVSFKSTTAYNVVEVALLVSCDFRPEEKPRGFLTLCGVPWAFTPKGWIPTEEEEEEEEMKRVATTKSRPLTS